MDITGLPSVKLMKTYLSWKAHKESKPTHLRNFDNSEFLYITKKNKSPRWNKYKCSLCLTPHTCTHISTNTLQKNSTKWQYMTKLRNYLPTKLTERLTLSKWVTKANRVRNEVHFDETRSQDTSWIIKRKITLLKFNI